MSIQSFTEQIASDTERQGGYLRCETCGITAEVDAAYWHTGWPTCHGYTMRWWTQRQIDAGEVPTLDVIGAWRPTDTGTCSRSHCREPAVAMLNRGMSQHHLGRTVDAWWRYCHTHLADYRKYVSDDGQVRWLTTGGPV